MSAWETAYTTVSIYAVEWYVWYGEHVPLAPAGPAVHLVLRMLTSVDTITATTSSLGRVGCLPLAWRLLAVGLGDVDAYLEHYTHKPHG